MCIAKAGYSLTGRWGQGTCIGGDSRLSHSCWRMKNALQYVFRYVAYFVPNSSDVAEKRLHQTTSLLVKASRQSNHYIENPYLDLPVRLFAHHDGVPEAEVEHHLRVDDPIAGLIKRVLDVGVQYIYRLRRFPSFQTGRRS